MVPISWAENPPVVRSKVYAELVWPIDRLGIHAICLNPSITGVYTHYVDGRTRPCAGKDCWCHREKRTPRWKGYIPILRCPSRKVQLLELTENAGQSLTRVSSAPKFLRGIHFHIFRRTNKLRSPVDVTVEPATFPHELPLGFDPVPVLLNLWGVQVRFTDGLPFPAEDEVRGTKRAKESGVSS